MPPPPRGEVYRLGVPWLAGFLGVVPAGFAVIGFGAGFGVGVFLSIVVLLGPIGRGTSGDTGPGGSRRRGGARSRGSASHHPCPFVADVAESQVLAV